MADSPTDRDYRLKLREGDTIQATVTSIGDGHTAVDTSLWANVNIATVSDTSDATSTAPGEELYATVADVADDTATLTQKQGVYRRNHLPGDSLRVRAMEQVSASLCRVLPESYRNLETVYVPGIGPGADATVRIAKIREGTAFALPETIHEPGLRPGQEVRVETTAGSRTARISHSSPDGDGTSPFNPPTVRLDTHAPASGPATVHLTEVSEERISGELLELSATLPSPGDRVETQVTHGSDQTTVSVEGGEVVASLETSCPVSGTAVLKLGDRTDGIYRAELVEYSEPQIRAGDTFEARVYAPDNRGKLQIDEHEIPVSLATDIETTGATTIEIVEIGGTIRGRVVDEIDPLSTGSQGSDDVDITDVSKF